MPTSSENDQALPLGTRLGDYRLDAIIGHGGFGITYRAFDTQLAKFVAIKEYFPVEFAVRRTDGEVGARGLHVALVHHEAELRALDALGLEVDAEFDAVRVAWRKLAKENHPDVKPGDADAAERFRQIQAAYDVLRAAEERRLAL